MFKLKIQVIAWINLSSFFIILSKLSSQAHLTKLSYKCSLFHMPQGSQQQSLYTSPRQKYNKTSEQYSHQAVSILSLTYWLLLLLRFD